MAGDWIKMRGELLTHPKVVRMMSALKADKFRIVGGLMSVWCLFDAHSEDGHLSGYTLEMLDTMAAWDGFSAAMVSINWLKADGDDQLSLPEFDCHNGQSAKRRAQDAERKRAVRNLSADEADKKRTREEKRREEKKEQKITPVGVVISDDEKQSRLAEVTQQAIDAFNATLSIQSGGSLSAVTLCSDKRKAQVKRTLKLASQACERLYGAKTVTPEFWVQYFEEVRRDPFKSGKGPYGKGHENWRPDFEYLTRPEIVEGVIDDAMSREAV